MRVRASIACATIAAFGAILLVSCTPTQPPTCPEMPSGQWYGSWRGTYFHGLAEADLAVSSSSISGTATLDGSTGGTGSVSGTISCSKVTLTITDDESPLFESTFVGNVQADALGFVLTTTYMSGGFTTPTTIPGVPDQGRLLLGWSPPPTTTTLTTTSTTTTSVPTTTDTMP